MTQVTFPEVGVVTLYEDLNQGMTRRAFNCDYTDEAGRRYVVKEAYKQDGYYHKGVDDNREEFFVYHEVREALRGIFPVFKDITPDGKYLLVERCTPVRDTEFYDANYSGLEFSDELDDEQYRVYNETFEDIHAGNVGYTEQDNRLVVIDIGTRFSGTDYIIQKINHKTKVHFNEQSQKSWILFEPWHKPKGLTDVFVPFLTLLGDTNEPQDLIKECYKKPAKVGALHP